MNYSGKKKFHASKAQAIITAEGRILFFDVQIDYCHDMTLFRQSRRDLSKACEILADSGYQGLMKLYPQAKTPIKSSKYSKVSGYKIHIRKSIDFLYFNEVSEKRVEKIFLSQLQQKE